MRQKYLGTADGNARRDNRRGVLDVTFEINGDDFPVLDVSMGGFQLAEAAGKLHPMQEVVVDSVMVGDDPPVEFGARAEVVYASPGKGGVGCRFIDLTSKQFDKVEALVMHRPLIRKKRAQKKSGGLMGLFRK